MVTFLALLPLHAVADFRLIAGESRAADGFVEIRVLPSIRLSSRAAEALVKGIPLTVNLDIHLYKETRFWWHTQVAAWQYPHKIQYHHRKKSDDLVQIEFSKICIFWRFFDGFLGLGRIFGDFLMDFRVLGRSFDDFLLKFVNDKISNKREGPMSSGEEQRL